MVEKEGGEGGGGPEAGRETYLEVERRGLVFRIKGGILTSLLEQSVQLLLSISFRKKNVSNNPLKIFPFPTSFLPSFPLDKKKIRKDSNTYLQKFILSRFRLQLTTFHNSLFKRRRFRCWCHFSFFFISFFCLQKRGGAMGDGG